jgi:hypothetical protein
MHNRVYLLCFNLKRSSQTFQRYLAVSMMIVATSNYEKSVNLYQVDFFKNQFFV